MKDMLKVFLAFVSCVFLIVLFLKLRSLFFCQMKDMLECFFFWSFFPLFFSRVLSSSRAVCSFSWSWLMDCARFVCPVLLYVSVSVCMCVCCVMMWCIVCEFFIVCCVCVRVCPCVCLCLCARTDRQTEREREKRERGERRERRERREREGERE